jgi:hypothetical protein
MSSILFINVQFLTDKLRKIAKICYKMLDIA